MQFARLSAFEGQLHGVERVRATAPPVFFTWPALVAGALVASVGDIPPVLTVPSWGMLIPMSERTCAQGGGRPA